MAVQKPPMGNQNFKARESGSALKKYHMLFATLIALGLSIVSYVLIFLLSLLLRRFPIGSLEFVTNLFLERGWIPYLEVFAFWTAIIGLFLKIPQIAAEFKAFQIMIFPADLGTHYGVAMGRKIMANIQSLPPKQRNLMLVNRVYKAIGRLVNTSDTSQMDDVLRTIGEVDRDVVDSTYSMVRYLIWLIPTVGFIGTVLGISLAIAQFPTLISTASASAGLEAVKGGLVEICKQLGVAFDTTLLALFMSAIIAYFMGMVRKKEDGLLTSVDEYCIENIVSRVVSIDAGSNVVLEGIKEAVKEMRLAVDEHGQMFQEKLDDMRMRMGTGELEKVLQRIGPAVGKEAQAPIPGLAPQAAELSPLVEAIRESGAEMNRREKILLEKMEQLLAAGERASGVVTEMKEFRNFTGHLEKQSRLLGDIQRTLALQQETMDRTNAALRDAVGMRDQIDEMKKMFATTGDMIARHLETVKRQEQVLDKALTVNKNVASLQGVLEKNEKAMNELARVLNRMTSLEKDRVSGEERPAQKKPPEKPGSSEEEIFLPEE